MSERQDLVAPRLVQDITGSLLTRSRKIYAGECLVNFQRYSGIKEILRSRESASFSRQAIVVLKPCAYLAVIALLPVVVLGYPLRLKSVGGDGLRARDSTVGERGTQHATKIQRDFLRRPFRARYSCT